MLIEVPHGQYIHLTFASFDLERRYDYVEIFDGNSVGSYRIAKASGYQTPRDIYSSGRFLFVRFRSDGSVTRRGFLALFRVVSNGKRHTCFIFLAKKID